MATGTTDQYIGFGEASLIEQVAAGSLANVASDGREAFVVMSECVERVLINIEA